MADSVCACGMPAIHGSMAECLIMVNARRRAAEARADRLAAALKNCITGLSICRIGDKHSADIGRVLDVAEAALAERPK